MPDKNTRFAALKKIVESFGLVVGTGKGSEARISDPHRTRKIMRIKKHGKNPQIQRQVISSLRTKFQISPEQGVSDEDFYGRG